MLTCVAVATRENMKRENTCKGKGQCEEKHPDANTLSFVIDESFLLTCTQDMLNANKDFENKRQFPVDDIAHLLD